MAANVHDFEPAKSGTYDIGKITIFFDNRTYKGLDDKVSIFQDVYLQGLSRLGWTSFSENEHVEPGKLRLIWYTHTGNQGKRDFPLWQANIVREAFDTLSQEGFRPCVLGWSGENPYPDIGGSEPPPPPAKPKEPKRATTYSASMSGHGKALGETPHDRVMAIIEAEDEREARLRAQEVATGEDEKLGGAV